MGGKGCRQQSLSFVPEMTPPLTWDDPWGRCEELEQWFLFFLPQVSTLLSPPLPPPPLPLFPSFLLSFFPSRLLALSPINPWFLFILPFLDDGNCGFSRSVLRDFSHVEGLASSWFYLQPYTKTLISASSSDLLVFPAPTSLSLLVRLYLQFPSHYLS